MNKVYYLIIFLVFLFVKHVSSTALPSWAKRRKQCPEAGNKTAWTIAKTKLDCLHSGDSNSKEQTRVYHCLPSNDLNEYVEFCGNNVPVQPGYCPVFKYLNLSGKNRGPNYKNCLHFQTGCPEELYHSKDIYKYPECLAINKIHKCYTANISCTTVEDVTSPSMKDYYKADTNEKWIAVPGAILPVLLIFVIVIVLVAVCGRKRRVFKSKGIDEETCLKRLKDDDAQCEDGLLGKGIDEETCLKRLKDDDAQCEDGLLAVKNKHEFKGLPVKRLLREIGKELKESDVEDLKYFLRSDDEEFKDRNTDVSRMDKFDLLEYMNKRYIFDLNIYILEGFMHNVNKKLEEKCIEFAKKNSNNQMIYYVYRGGFRGHTDILVKLKREKNNFTQEEAECIVQHIQDLLKASRDQIILHGISEGCIQLHLAIQNTLLSRLRMSNLQSLHKYHVFKVSTREECIYYRPDCDFKKEVKNLSKGNFPSKDISNSTTSFEEGDHMRVNVESFHTRLLSSVTNKPDSQTKFVPNWSANLLRSNRGFLFMNIWAKQERQMDTKKRRSLTADGDIENFKQGVYPAWIKISRRIEREKIASNEFQGRCRDMPILNLDRKILAERKKGRIKDRLQEDRQQRELEKSATVAMVNLIKRVVRKYKLKDFLEPIETIVKIMQEPNSTMSEYYAFLIVTCNILKNVGEEEMTWFKEFINRKQIINWLRTSLYSLEIFVKFACKATGYVELKFLQAAITGHGPLIFNLDEQCEYSKLFERCQVDWKELMSDPDLLGKLMYMEYRLRIKNNFDDLTNKALRYLQADAFKKGISRQEIMELSSPPRILISSELSKIFRKGNEECIQIKVKRIVANEICDLSGCEMKREKLTIDTQLAGLRMLNNISRAMPFSVFAFANAKYTSVECGQVNLRFGSDVQILIKAGFSYEFALMYSTTLWRSQVPNDAIVRKCFSENTPGPSFPKKQNIFSGCFTRFHPKMALLLSPYFQSKI